MCLLKIESFTTFFIKNDSSVLQQNNLSSLLHNLILNYNKKGSLSNIINDIENKIKKLNKILQQI